MELIDLVNSVIIFLCQTTLLDPRLLFSQSCCFGFVSSDAIIFCTMAFPPLGNSDHVVVSVFIDFPSDSQRDTLFHCMAYDYSCVDWDGLHDDLRDVPWEDSFKLSASASASECCEWVKVEINVYIPHCKYQVKPHSSPCF